MLLNMQLVILAWSLLFLLLSMLPIKQIATWLIYVDQLTVDTIMELANVQILHSICIFETSDLNHNFSGGNLQQSRGSWY